MALKKLENGTDESVLFLIDIHNNVIYDDL